ncbi:MAG: hypothetical protein DKINENOH_01601 [bacterium]|nr:hypothetical protein [bacterium]MCK6562245.1 hypothetical protein [bacterium]NUM67635.1 hypothetical protein [candidate division KSB1 bacterium]
MQAYEFKLETSDRGELMIPAEIQRILPQLKRARVILLLDDDGTEWQRFTSASYDDVPAAEIARLAEAGGAFDFLADPEEDIYSDEDLKVRYR